MNLKKRFISLLTAGAVMLSGMSSDIPFLPSLSITAGAVTSADLSISDNGFWFICGAEGFRSTCYPDTSQSSIGYGTKCTGSSEQPHAAGLHSITEPEARSIAKSQIDNRYSATVRKQTVGLEMNQNQFDALVSLAYNTGGGTNIISNSPLVLYLKGYYSEATARSAYSSYYVKSGGVVLQGLINRRNKEADLFFTESHKHSYYLSCSIEPDCTTDGWIRYRCECGDTYLETLTKLGHNDVVSYILPTMTEAGSVRYTCTRCSRVYDAETLPAPELKSDGWYYSKVLPSGITSDNCDIEYYNSYETVQSYSPGNDWTQGEEVSREWINSGDVYPSWYELPTSDSRVLIDSYYYHYCSATTGSVVNYEATSEYVHGDSVALDLVTVEKTGLDGDITYYILKWNSNGTRVYCNSNSTCDGSYGTHGNRAYAWYKMNWYQDRYQVVNYRYTKNSGWVEYSDPSATSTTCRFKYKNAAPTNVKASAGDGKVTLTWDEVSGATNYAVFLRKGTEWLKIGASGTNTTFTSRGLANGGKYFYMVKAYANGVWSEESAIVSAIPVCITPQNVKASAGDGKVTLTWDAVPGASNYAVFLRKGTTWLKIGSSGAGTTFTSRGLANGGKYFYMVKAYVNGSWSDESAIVSAIPVCITPQNVKAVGGTGEATITWDAVTGASNYVVMVKKGTSWVTLGAAGTKTTYTAKDLTGGETYYFVVKAYVNGAWSDMSETVSASVS